MRPARRTRTWGPRLSRLTAGACLLIASPAPAGPVGDVADWCAAMREATVQVRGDVLLYGPADGSEGGSAHIEAFRAGSGFWIADGVVVTAHHVVARMDRIEVCAEDGACSPVVSVIGWPGSDVALLQLDGATAPRVFKITAPRGPGQAIVAAGYPGDVGFVCGPGHVTGALERTRPPFLLFEGTVAAEGSSGGPIAVLGKTPKRLEAIGAVSGATSVGNVRFNRGAPLEMVAQGLDAARAPVDWREVQPWVEERTVDLKLRPGRAHWEDIAVPALQDVELVGGEGLCYGLYRAPAQLLAADGLDPEPIAWSCSGEAVRYTTRADEVVRLGLWSEAAAGFDGQVVLRLR